MAWIRPYPGESWGVDLQQGTLLTFLALTLLVAGTVAGALAVIHLEPVQRQDLYALLSNFLQGLGDEPNRLNASAVLAKSLWGNIKTAGLLWVLGLTVVGIPVVALIIFIRGFLVGFTVGFLVHQMGWKGIAFSLASVFPQNLLAVPALLVLAISSASFSLFLVRRNSRRCSVIAEFLRYTKLAVACAVIMALAALVEAYLVPPLMAWLSRVVS